MIEFLDDMINKKLVEYNQHNQFCSVTGISIQSWSRKYTKLMMKSYKIYSQDDSYVNKEMHFQDKLHQVAKQDARQTCDFAAVLKILNEF